MSDPANKTIYRNVLVSLLILTMLTVGVSRIHLGTAGNVTVGILIAIIKASLVVLFFMHLKYEARWWAGIVLFPLALVVIIIFANLPDTGYGNYTTPAVQDLHGGSHGGGHGGGTPAGH